jgi:hypothetical protein
MNQASLSFCMLADWENQTKHSACILFVLQKSQNNIIKWASNFCISLKDFFFELVAYEDIKLVELELKNIQGYFLENLKTVLIS